MGDKTETERVEDTSLAKLRWVSWTGFLFAYTNAGSFDFAQDRLFDSIIAAR